MLKRMYIVFKQLMSDEGKRLKAALEAALLPFGPPALNSLSAFSIFILTSFGSFLAFSIADKTVGSIEGPTGGRVPVGNLVGLISPISKSFCGFADLL